MRTRLQRFAVVLWRNLRARLTAMQVTALIFAAGVGSLLADGHGEWVPLVLPGLALALAVDNDDRDEP